MVSKDQQFVALAPPGQALSGPAKSHRRSRLSWSIFPVLALAATASCSSSSAGEEPGEAASEAVAAEASAISPSAVGLALQVENGVGVPLQLRAGQTFYVNQIDLRAAIDTGVDEGVSGLATSGDFAGLSLAACEAGQSGRTEPPERRWDVQSPPVLQRSVVDEAKSTFRLEQLDATGKVLGPVVELDIGKDDKRKDGDAFFIRRLRAIQWTYGCASPSDCSNPASFQEEALVEVRDAMNPRKPFTLKPSTTALRLSWSLRSGPGYLIPVSQVASPPYAYGFSIDIDPLTPPGPNGTYAPGTDITFQATLRDGAGARLHPPGALPSFIEAELAPNATGIRYYNAFFDPTVVYYRRKHRERMMIAQFLGPLQDTQPIRSIVEFDDFFNPDGIQHVGLPQRDGFFADALLFPRGYALFGGAFNPTHAAWAAPVSDTWTSHIPDNALPGTYIVTMKARRVYLGEDTPFTRTITVQVGSPAPTSAALPTGKCGACHGGGGSLADILHANDNLASCNGCHAAIAIELDNPVYSRAHFIHSRSGRYDAPLKKCSQCHKANASIQRTSKSACLSCHTTYPSSHVNQFGPITSPFVGGGPESLQQCATTCHLTHPGSGLGGGHD